MKKTRRLATCLAAILLTLGTTSAQAKVDQSYILATASTGGTYYPVGVALATLTKVKLQPKKGFSLSAISSAGSGENVKLLRDNEAQFAIMQGLYGAWAANGEGRLEQSGPQKHLRSITMLWQNVEHFVIKSDLAKTGTVADLKNFNDRKFSIGKRNSGTEGSGRQILSGLNIDPSTFKLAYMGYGASADALMNGTVSGMNIPAGVPVGAVTKAFAKDGDDLTILSFTDEQMQKANGDYKLWTRFVIPAGTYPEQKEAVQTIAQPNFLATRSDLDDETVYLLTKTIYENLPFLNGIHKATTAMSVEKAIAGLPLPLHPGAARYYREQGIDVPEHLTTD